MDDIYQTTDYTKWYEKFLKNQGNSQPMSNGGVLAAPTKTDEMSDADYQIGQTLYRAYLENQRLDSEYGNGVKALDKAKDDAEISADITLQRMQKYLPQQLAKQGLYGTGMSEDAYLRLQNQYQQSVSDAARSYTDGLSRLESAYQQNKNSVWEQANTGVNTVVANAEANSQAMYDEAYAALDPSLLTSEADVDEILEQYKSKLSSVHYDNLERYANALKEDIEKSAKFNSKGQTTEASFSNPSGTQSYAKGDNFEITVSNNPYKVQSGGEATGNVLAWATARELDDGSVFVYDGEVYIYKGGIVYTVEKRPTSDDHERLKKALLNEENPNDDTQTDGESKSIGTYHATGSNNINIIYDNKKYNATSGDYDKQASISAKSHGIKDGSVFVYNDSLYIYTTDNYGQGWAYKVKDFDLPKAKTGN